MPAITVVDAFADRPFAGNPAAVCVLPHPQDNAWMQAVAREMNLSETAFLIPEGNRYNLRWFTPAIEVGLCGHATLASAHVLWEEGQIPADSEARFLTRGGPLMASRQGSWIEMNFPVERESPIVPVPGLARALGVNPIYVGKNRFDVLVEVATEDEVRQAVPDFDALRRIPARGFIVTSRAGGTGYDFVSRFFAPAGGINEDPVTGSSHCCLGPFWGRRLGKAEMVGYQASARGGVVRVRVGDDRVHLAGQAITVLRGELRA